MQSFRGQTRFIMGNVLMANANFPPSFSKSRGLQKPLLRWFGYSNVLGIPIPKTLVVIWTSPSHITSAIWVRVRVRVTWDAHITRVLGMGMPISLWHNTIKKKWYHYFSRLRFDKNLTSLRGVGGGGGILSGLPKALTRSWKLYTVSSFGHSFVPVGKFGS